MLLTGNHEQWFIEYANEEYENDLTHVLNSEPIEYSYVCKSHEFISNTAPMLEKFSKKDLRQLCRKFIQCAYLQYGENKFICTHAGLGFMPKNLVNPITIPDAIIILNNSLKVSLLLIFLKLLTLSIVILFNFKLFINLSSSFS